MCVPCVSVLHEMSGQSADCQARLPLNTVHGSSSVVFSVFPETNAFDRCQKGLPSTDKYKSLSVTMGGVWRGGSVGVGGTW